MSGPVLRTFSCSRRPRHEPARQKFFQQRIIEARQRRRDREPVEEGKIAAENEDDLKTHQQNSGDVAAPPRPEGEPRHDQLDHVVP